MKDRLFHKPLPSITPFSFNKDTVRVFDDMVRRSVPFYEEILRMCAEISHHFYQKSTYIYDLGCSTGNLIRLLQAQFSGEEFLYKGIDSSSEMLIKARSRFKGCSNILFEEATIEDLQIKNSSIVIANYIFQFIHVKKRESVIEHIYRCLPRKGVFMISEKIDTKKKIFKDFHHGFKKRKGYSEIEISQKREALDQSLVSLSLQKNIEMLEQAGFQDIVVFFKWYNFASLLGQKI